MKGKINALTLFTNSLEILRKVYHDEEARAILFELIESQYGLARHDIFLGTEISNFDNEKFAGLLNRLEQKEPIQYVVG